MNNYLWKAEGTGLFKMIGKNGLERFQIPEEHPSVQQVVIYFAVLHVFCTEQLFWFCIALGPRSCALGKMPSKLGFSWAFLTKKRGAIIALWMVEVQWVVSRVPRRMDGVMGDQWFGMGYACPLCAPSIA
ncbi:hypothetical protein [Deinococcus roseus]|uniref:hypothetical protein n=1 Tax=Deinococcus roseus TaxID=392414 RepID=UPI00188C9E0C|nr:hypothetical protein [Deinococcus roseus]